MHGERGASQNNKKSSHMTASLKFIAKTAIIQLVERGDPLNALRHSE